MSLKINQEKECIPNNLDINNECNEKSFIDLPIEIIERVFEHLPYSDLKTSSCVCQKWCQVSQLPKFRRNILLKIRHSKIDETNLPEELFQKSTRKFCNLYFGFKKPNYIINIMEYFLKMSNIFEDLEYFKLENVALTFEDLCITLSRMRNLKSLSIKKCKFKLDTTEQIEKKHLESIRNTMHNLISFEFQKAEMINYNKLSQITEMLSKLEILKPGFKRIESYSDAMDETNILCSIIEKNKTTLKELNIPMYQNKLPLSEVYKIQNLNLKQLSVDYNYFSPPAILTLDNFLQVHVNLTVLVLSIRSYRKLDLNLIAENMHLLERLEITSYCQNIHNFSLLTISKFNNLKVLKAFDRKCHFFSSDELASNMILKELHIQYMNLTETDLINISERLPNLESLHLASTLLTDSGLQAVIKNLLNLKYLHLDLSERKQTLNWTECGISGCYSGRNMLTGISIMNLKNLEYLYLAGIVIRSKECLLNNLKFPKIKKICIYNNFNQFGVMLSLFDRDVIFENCPKLKELFVN